MNMAEREWILREFDLFRDLTDDEVDQVGAAAPMSQLPAGQMLYSPDRRPHGVTEGPRRRLRREPAS